MTAVRVRVRRLPGADPALPLPAYQTAGAAGMDVAANLALFAEFTLGICAPLLAFSLASRAASRSMVTALVRYERPIGIVAGAVMVGVAVYYLGWVFEVFG